MGYSVKILLDSVGPSGKRLTTWELTYPRFVHAELMTHRQFSRNSASSRAIPNEKLRQRVADDPAMPVWWGKNQAGMQAREELSDDAIYTCPNKMCGSFSLFVGLDHVCLTGSEKPFELSPREKVKRLWLQARDAALAYSEGLAELGLHKQLCNRLIEPWMFITVIVSATEYDNWFHLRDHKDAQPEIAWVAGEMRRQYVASIPVRRDEGEWHMPLVNSQQDVDDVSAILMRERSINDRAHVLHVDMVALLKKVSVGRCARVSYLTHDGKRDLAEDIKLHDRLIAGMETGEPLHMSPFEHVAQALALDESSGNFRGWKQYRKEFARECANGMR